MNMFDVGNNGRESQGRIFKALLKYCSQRIYHAAFVPLSSIEALDNVDNHSVVTANRTGK